MAGIVTQLNDLAGEVVTNALLVIAAGLTIAALTWGGKKLIRVFKSFSS